MDSSWTSTVPTLSVYHRNFDRGNKNCAHKKNRKSGQCKPFIFFDQKV